MDQATALEIVRDYIEVALTEGSARKLSILPYPKSVIKYAIMGYLDHALFEQILNEEQLHHIKTAYGRLDHFMDDEKAEVINSIVNRVNSKELNLDLESNRKAKMIYDNFAKLFNNTKNLDEITEFADVMIQLKEMNQD